MKGKILKVSLVAILIIVMTMANFIFVGESLISYALDNTSVATDTNNRNVQFGAYFKDDSGNIVETLNKGIYDENTKMYLNVNVQNEGYFNGSIELKDSNFDIISSQSEYVNKIENNKITLNQINAGTNVVIEVSIKLKTEENVELSLLNMQSELILNGIYKDSSEKDITINSSRKVNVSIVNTNSSKENVNNNLSIITNKILKVNGEDKRVVQLSLKAGLAENNYPIKSINIEVNVPSINNKQPTIEKIVNMNTMLSYNYNYSGTDKKVTINMENNASTDTQNRILWKKSGNEEIILTYIYDSDANIDTTKITSNEIITLHNDEKIEANTSTVTLGKKEIESIITGKITNTETQMYKGKLYSGLDRDFSTNSTINVNLANAVQYLEIKEIDTLNTLTKQTIINKEKLFKILGQEGSAVVTNAEGTQIATINNQTQSDENGNIVLDYGEGQQGIKIKTTKPVATGKIEISNKKTIKINDVSQLKSDTEFKTTLQVSNDINLTEEAEANIMGTAIVELKESTTEAKLEVNRDSLSTVTTNKNVKIVATLKSNNEQYDLYKNPEIKITFPEDITNITLNAIDKIYGDEFTQTHTTTIENGRNVITIKLSGEQTNYKEIGIEGTTMILDVDLTLNNKATSKTSSFDMIYTNEKVNQYKDNKSQGEENAKMSIVSPKGLITTNDIKDLEIKTIGEQELTTKTLQKGAEAKQVSVTSEIINNNESEIKDVAIIGDFGTNGKTTINNQKEQNDLGLTLKSTLKIDGIDTSKVKIYYTENENATTDVKNKDNVWKQEITDYSKIRKYLIVITSMDALEKIQTSYDIEIPANLDYNQQAYQGYTAIYQDSLTQTQGQVNSTKIKLETGKGAVSEIQLGAAIGGKTVESGKDVKQGEVIRYVITAKNTGNIDLNNATITANVPDGTKLVVAEENYDITTDTYYKELEDKVKTFTIETLKAGESITKEYEVRVSTNTEVGKILTNTANIKYGDVTKTTNEFTNKVTSGNIRITVKSIITPDIKIAEGESGKFVAIIENISGKEQKNIKFDWVLPEGVTFATQEVVKVEGKNAETLIEETTDKSFNIDTLGANQKVITCATLNFDKITSTDNTENIIGISATAQLDDDKYESNQYGVITEKTSKYSISLTANNENGYMKSGDEINYTIIVKNLSDVEFKGAYIKDQISKRLTIKEVTINGEAIDISKISSNNIELDSLDFAANETKTIVIKTVVNYEEGRAEEKISNQAKLYAGASNQKESNIVSHTIEEEELLPDGTVAHRINGIAWIDENKDGVKEETETKLEGINVKLLNITTNKIQTNYNNEEISAKTDKNGYYTLTKIPQGDYIVIFEYDSTQYGITTYKAEGIDEIKNSDVLSKTLNIDGTERIYAVTDNLKIAEENMSNVNMGLIKAQIFDMKLDKYVSQITVQNSSETKTYAYNQEALAKIELASKRIANTSVIIEYNIVVSNIGEVDGYIKNVVDYAPTDLKFSSELNKDWYKASDGSICTNSLANTKIASGEQKTLTLILTKTMTENNVGRINNTAEIAESYNDLGTEDINSVAGNKTQGENDMGSADVIVSLKTGEILIYSSLAIVAIITLGAGVYFIKKRMM